MVFAACLGLSCWSDNEIEVTEVVHETKSRDEYNPEITDIPVLECTYGTHPHALYAAIERRDWNEASKLLGPTEDQSADAEEKKTEDEKNMAEHEPTAEDQSVDGEEKTMEDEKKMSEQEVLARTWIVRKNEDGTIEWRMLPIHGAVVFDAPADILEKLLKIHPDGAKLKDNQGNLPLHLGYSEGRSVETVELLTKAYPEGEGIKNKKDCVPGENLGPSAAVQKMRDDISKQLAELDEKRRSEIDEKEKEITGIKENYNAELKTLEEAKENEIRALQEKLEKSGVEHEGTLKQITEEKEREIEQLKQDLAQQKDGEIERLKKDLAQQKDGEIEQLKQSLEKQKNEEIEKLKQNLEQQERELVELKEKREQAEEEKSKQAEEERTPAPEEETPVPTLQEPPKKKSPKSKSSFFLTDLMKVKAERPAVPPKKFPFNPVSPRNKKKESRTTEKTKAKVAAAE